MNGKKQGDGIGLSLDEAIDLLKKRIDGLRGANPKQPLDFAARMGSVDRAMDYVKFRLSPPIEKKQKR